VLCAGLGVQGTVLGGTWGAIFMVNKVWCMLGWVVLFIVCFINTVFVIDVVARLGHTGGRIGKASVVLVTCSGIGIFRSSRVRMAGENTCSKILSSSA